MGAKLSIAELKELIGGVTGEFSRTTRAFSLYPPGIPQSRIVEVCGAGKTEFVAQFLKENSTWDALWVEPKISVNPYGLWQRGVNLDSLLFIESGRETSWTLQQVLKSQIFKIVVVSDAQFDDQELRRFQILMEKVPGYFFLLSENFHKSWVSTVKIDLEAKAS